MHVRRHQLADTLIRICGMSERSVKLMIDEDPDYADKVCIRYSYPVKAAAEYIREMHGGLSRGLLRGQTWRRQAMKLSINMASTAYRVYVVANDASVGICIQFADEESVLGPDAEHGVSEITLWGIEGAVQVLKQAAETGQLVIDAAANLDD